jgi:hypothetical protein
VFWWAFLVIVTPIKNAHFTKTQHPNLTILSLSSYCRQVKTIFLRPGILWEPLILPSRTTLFAATVTHIPTTKGGYFLSTRLVDFTLHQTMKESIPEGEVIGISLSMMYFDMMITKRVMKKHLDIIRQKYLPYSANRFHFLAANCTNPHFFVIQATFDGRNSAIFENVTVYDSMRESQPSTITMPAGSFHSSSRSFVLSLFFLTALATTTSSTIPSLFCKMLHSPTVPNKENPMIVCYSL